MPDRDVSSPDVQRDLVDGAQERMTKLAQSWLANPKVTTSMNRFDPTEIDLKIAS